MLNNRKVICHEYALKSMQKVKEISLAHYQGVSSSQMNMPPFATQR